MVASAFAFAFAIVLHPAIAFGAAFAAVPAVASGRFVVVAAVVDLASERFGKTVAVAVAEGAFEKSAAAVAAGNFEMPSEVLPSSFVAAEAARAGAGGPVLECRWSFGWPVAASVAVLAAIEVEAGPPSHVAKNTLSHWVRRLSLGY